MTVSSFELLNGGKAMLIDTEARFCLRSGPEGAIKHLKVNLKMTFHVVLAKLQFIGAEWWVVVIWAVAANSIFSRSMEM